MEENMEAVTPMIDVILVGIPLLMATVLVIYHTFDSKIKYYYINFILSTIYGITSSFIVLQIGLLYDVTGYPLWASTALGVILGFEVYKFHLFRLASRKVKLAEKLRKIS